MDLALTDKVVLITGAGHGIGKQIALDFARHKSRVAVNDIDAQSLAECYEEIADYDSPGVIKHVADITDYCKVDNMVQEILNKWGRIDVLVNGAGVIKHASFVKTAVEDWAREINVCLLGTMHCTRAVIGSMIDKNYGKILNIASDAARVGSPYSSVYSAAKGGVISFTKSLAREVGPNNINVNCISPSATDTPLRRAAELAIRNKIGEEKYSQREEKILSMYPLRRIGTTADISNSILFLSSDVSRHITGQIISVNGGFCMV